MSETTPPPTASKRAASPFSPETGTVSKRVREETEEEKPEVSVDEGEEKQTDNENGNDNGNGSGEVKKMEDVPMEG
jgi:hypothetical protein